MTAHTDLIARAEASLVGVTPGPWRVSDLDVRTSAFVAAPNFGHVCNAPVPMADCYELEANRNSQARKNIAFIAAARTLIPELLAVIKATAPAKVGEDMQAIIDGLHARVAYFDNRSNVIATPNKDQALIRDAYDALTSAYARIGELEAEKADRAILIEGLELQAEIAAENTGKARSARKAAEAQVTALRAALEIAQVALTPFAATSLSGIEFQRADEALCVVCEALASSPPTGAVNAVRDAVLAERERCAQAVKAVGRFIPEDAALRTAWQSGKREGVEQAIAAIRARPTPEPKPAPAEKERRT